MRAVVFDGPGRVRVAEVPDPSLQAPTDAIVRVLRTAICGSDLHFLHAKAPIEPGEVLGHEAVGLVEAVGDGVRRFRPGDRVVVSFDIACGVCWFCEHGQTSLCEDFMNLGAGAFGGGLPGAQADRVRIPVADVNLLAVPDDVDDDHALFVGDVLTTGLFAAGLASIGRGTSVAVLGVGPVGFFAIQAARNRGATVFGVDREPARLALASAAGAEPIDATAVHAPMALAARTGNRGPDVVIEAVGTPDAYETAIEIVRRGGEVVVVGMYAGESVEIQLGVYWARALTVRFAGICPVHAWWTRAMQEVRAGRLDPAPLISHRLPLADAAEGYALFDRREATKVLLLP